MANSLENTIPISQGQVTLTEWGVKDLSYRAHWLDDYHFFIVSIMMTPTYVSAGFGSIQVPGTWILIPQTDEQRRLFKIIYYK